MQSTGGEEIRIGDTVWFTQDNKDNRPEPKSEEPGPSLDSGRVVAVDEGNGGLEVAMAHGHELIGLYMIQFVQPATK